MVSSYIYNKYGLSLLLIVNGYNWLIMIEWNQFFREMNFGLDFPKTNHVSIWDINCSE